MQNAESLRDIYRKRGERGLPLERVYRQLFNPELYLRAYGKIYRNAGAMTKGSTDDTVDGMSLSKIRRIIDLLRREKYRWSPARRLEIPKPKGGTRPLGLPTWSDKLLQEVLRSLLEAYYEPRFSNHSHGFRPCRAPVTALGEIERTWQGTVWFIEGDISKCFDSFDHDVLLSILRRDIKDERLIRLIEHLLKAGYFADWRFNDTLSGTPQGGIISPLLSNIYLNEMDGFVENTLIPEYTRGARRRYNKEYAAVTERIQRAKKRGDWAKVVEMRRYRRTLPSKDPFEAAYRRLRYVRYADDFLLSFAGPKIEAEAIRDKLSAFLEQHLKLNLSSSKTLITHAVDEKAHFLGYDITITRCHHLLAANGKRGTNGHICFLMPGGVAKAVDRDHRRNGKIAKKSALLQDTDYTILQRFQSVYRGIYNYFRLATDVSRQMSRVRRVLEESLVKTLAGKYRSTVRRMYKRYRSISPDGLKQLQVVVAREGKRPLVATFGGFHVNRVRVGDTALPDISLRQAWYKFANRRVELVTRLLTDQCELCGATGSVEVHHIHKLSDIDRPGRRPRTNAEISMAARRRKTLVVCVSCHHEIHAGRYDGPSFR